MLVAVNIRADVDESQPPVVTFIHQNMDFNENNKRKKNTYWIMRRCQVIDPVVLVQTCGGAGAGLHVWTSCLGSNTKVTYESPTM